MKCPNCGFSFRHGDICPDCGVDVIIFKKTRNISIKLYNKGLEQAKNSDLTGAIQSLEQSLAFDKKNKDARNLLGLIYYEVGQIADALKHWIISASLFIENNDAQRYMNNLQNNAREMEKMNDAVRMYNQSIIYLQQKSEDLAVIQLKKALDCNPNFVKAYNLLIFCYLQKHEYASAKECIQSVLSMDINNSFAQCYESQINPSKKDTIGKGENKKGEQVKSRSNIGNYKRNDTKSVIGKNEIIAFAVGIVCTAAVIMILILPAYVEEKEKTISDLKSQIVQLEGSGGEVTGDNKDAILKLQQEIKTLKEENEKYKLEADKQAKTVNLQQAITLTEQESYEEAALLIVNMESSTLEDAEKAQYNTVKETAFPQAAQSFYSKGKNEFLNNNYSEAQGYLENTLKFVSDENFVDDTLYYLGKIAESKNDNEMAKKYFEKIVNEFPESNQLNNAQNSLSSLVE